MRILAFETSCDETSISILEDDIVRANLIFSQDFHKEYGGVVPELSSRAHIQKISPLLSEALHKADITLKSVTHIAATAGPGLIGALMTGFTFAKGLCVSLGLPFVPVNHIEGHIFSSFLSTPVPEYPFLCLVVSGGHTMLFLIRGPLDFKLVGTTIDDAAGEAFDKVAKILNLGYPGGPKIQKCAGEGNPDAIQFPIAEVKNKYDFSFSGLKTAVLRYCQQAAAEGEAILHAKKPDIAASFQKTVVVSLTKKIQKAIDSFAPRGLALVGGVAANKALREAVFHLGAKYSLPVSIPGFEYCGDNAAMIAMRARTLLEAGQEFPLHYDTFPSFRSAYLTN